MEDVTGWIPIGIKFQVNDHQSAKHIINQDTDEQDTLLEEKTQNDPMIARTSQLIDKLQTTHKTQFEIITSMISRDANLKMNAARRPI